MHRHALRDFLAFASEARFGLNRLVIAFEVFAAGFLISIIEMLDQAGTEVSTLGSLIAQHVGHVLAPVLIVPPIAAHPDGMRGPQHGGEVGGVPEIIRPAQGKTGLCKACA